MVDVAQYALLEEARNAEKHEGDWVSKPAIPASTVAATNTADYAMRVEVAGGTVTVVKVNDVTIGARVAGEFLVPPGGTIKLTYSVAPTWQWFAAL